ncbi:copper-binding protein [Brevundimonas naejangsanensis]|uniref:Copper-binding protein n=1 Tax=Brevundimonas naejangsanensis TaxID=588932 RepID=A0A494RK90_9CAUL|nr:cupredoxin domain-containing protein [Brevundimonas naejangsanensis]AYG94960.1 copper-binding protein [Brevundimonas naejangsanensis]
MLRTGLMIAAAALIVALPASSTPSSAQASAQEAGPMVVEMQLKNFDFTPSTVHLRRGVPVVLRLVDAGGSHSFSAPELFAASTLDPTTAALIRNGKVEVREGGVELRLTPNTAGSYAFRCTHFMHSAFGMKGTVIVD